MQLPDISKNAIKSLSNIFISRTKVIHIQTRQFSPHIKTVAMMAVDEVKKKADYGPDLFQMVYHAGMSVAKSAEKLGMSPSYAYKLYNKELLKRGLSGKKK